MLSEQHKSAPDSSTTESERLLDEFVRLHPMCSLEACSASTISMLAACQSNRGIRAAPSTCSNKRHDDQFLRPPNPAVGERKCACDEACLCKFIARVRYGKADTRGFICREYLTPSQNSDFLQGRKLPALRSKCLVCYRYLMTYVYTLARNDHGFSFPVLSQRSGDASHPSGEDAAALHSFLECANEEDVLPLRVSEMGTADGYHPSAMLMPDEEFANRRAARTSCLSSLLLEPTVRFCSHNYQYVKSQDLSSERQWEIVQTGIGMPEALQELGFAPPPLQQADPMAAANSARPPP